MVPDDDVQPLPCNPCEHYRKQDLPPAGGYKPIPWRRVPAKQIFSGWMLILGFAAVTTGSMYLYSLSAKRVKKHEIELRSSKMAIYPMLLAERDREYLKQLRRNRDEEERLMQYIPDWEVGQYYDEKIYHLIPDDDFVEPIFHEYYAHAAPREWYRRTSVKLRS